MKSAGRFGLVISTGLIFLAGLSLPEAEAADWSPSPAIVADIYAPAGGDKKIYVGDQTDARCASMDMDTLDGNQYPDTIPEGNITWEALRGTFPNGNTGSDVVWQAPATPSAQANDIWIKVTVDDLPAENDPPGGGTRDDDPVTDTIYVTAWDAEIEKCGDWLPIKDGTVKITARVKPTGVNGFMIFSLSGVSTEPGYCMNAGSESTTDRDLQFENQDGFLIAGPYNEDAYTVDEQQQLMAVNSAEVIVTSYDYGSWGQIRALIREEDTDVTEYAHVVDEEGTYVDIPRDDDDNKIADSADQNHDSTLLDGGINATATTITVDSTLGMPEFASEGTRTMRIDDEQITYTGGTPTTITGCTRGANGTAAAAHADNASVEWWHNDHDSEENPLGDGTKGDGFTRYQEYRGFVSMENHIRLDPSEKEVFVFDYIGYGTGDYPNLGPTVYQVGQYERTILNVVNPNRETAPGHEQKCVYLASDEVWDEGEYGHCFPDPPGVGTPNQQTHIYLYTGNIAADAQALFGENWEAPATSMLQRVIGHECGHYTNIPHHAQGGCVMHTPADDWFNIPHTYCTNNPGCQYLFKLH